MDFNVERVRRNVRQASTEELLDRLTVYRTGMEPAAIEVIEAELDRRGVGAEQVRQHAGRRADVLTACGIARRCSRCDRPAVQRRWGWHRLWGRVPVFPRPYLYCEVHRKP